MLCFETPYGNNAVLLFIYYSETLGIQLLNYMSWIFMLEGTETSGAILPGGHWPLHGQGRGKLGEGLDPGG
jgi:hypothetical protein